MNMLKDYELLKKAIDTSVSNGNNVLTPSVLSDVISNSIQVIPTLRNYIKRIDWPTNVFQWNTRVTPTTATTAADGAQILFSNPAYARGTATMSYLYDLFAVTGPMRASSMPLLDIVAEELQQGMMQMLRKEDALIIGGDSNNSSFPGLLASTTGTVPTSAVGGSGKMLSRLLFDNIETYQNAAGYTVDAWAVSPNVYALLKNVAYNSVRFTNITEDSQAFIGYSQSAVSTLMLNGKPCFMEPNLAVGSTNNVLALSLDPANLVTAVLKQPTIIAFENVEPQYDRNSYRIEEYFVTILRNPLSAVSLTNCTIPTPSAF